MEIVYETLNVPNRTTERLRSGGAWQYCGSTTACSVDSG